MRGEMDARVKRAHDVKGTVSRVGIANVVGDRHFDSVPHVGFTAVGQPLTSVLGRSVPRAVSLCQRPSVSS